MFADGIECLLEDGAYVPEPRLQEHLGLHTLYLQLDPREPRVDPDREAQEISKLCQDRDVCPKTLNLQVDPVDLKFGDVKQHVGLLSVGLLTVGLLAG